MGEKKAVPQKVKGTVTLAGKEVKIGSVQSTTTSTSNTEKAIKRIVKNKIFPAIQFLNE